MLEGGEGATKTNIPKSIKTNSNMLYFSSNMYPTIDVCVSICVHSPILFFHFIFCCLHVVFGEGGHVKLY